VWSVGDDAQREEVQIGWLCGCGDIKKGTQNSDSDGERFLGFFASWLCPSTVAPKSLLRTHPARFARQLISIGISTRSQFLCFSGLLVLFLLRVSNVFSLWSCHSFFLTQFRCFCFSQALLFNSDASIMDSITTSVYSAEKIDPFAARDVSEPARRQAFVTLIVSHFMLLILGFLTFTQLAGEHKGALFFLLLLLLFL
jgi:hypothetical protein